MTNPPTSQEAREAAELLPTVTEALLPCPFCGSPAELSDLGDPQDDSMVNCTNQRGCGMQQIARFTPEGAVAAWNTRARPQDTDREAAKALLDQLAVRFHRDGTFRDWDKTVQAFARHREQAERGTLARHQTGGEHEVIAKVVHENGPVVIDWMGEQLAWRPLDYGTWTPLPVAPSHPNDEVRALREALREVEHAESIEIARRIARAALSGEGRG